MHFGWFFLVHPLIFSAFGSESFQKLIGPIANQIDVSLDKDQVQAYVVKVGKEQKDKMKADMNKSFIFLKFDCATRLRVNYLGLNARYIDNYKPVTKTLAVIDTKSKHSSNAIKKMILNSLEEYEIPLTNVLVGVTDNATNMVKCMADLKSLQAKELVDVDGDESDDDDDEEYGEGSGDTRPQ